MQPSPPAPPPPPPAVVDPLVTVHVTYRCNPCRDDSDNYRIHLERMQCPSAPCAWSAGPADHLLEFNSMTFSGHLPPGPYQLELRVGNVETAVDVLFSSSGVSENTGGVVPNSIRVLDSFGADIDRFTIGPCSVRNAFRRRPPAGIYEPLFAFDVWLGTVGPVC